MNFRKTRLFTVLFTALLFITSCSEDDTPKDEATDNDTASTAGVQDKEDDSIDLNLAGEDVFAGDTMAVQSSEKEEPLTGQGGSEKELKIGYVSAMEILYKLPDVTAAEKKLQQYAQTLDQHYKQETQKFQQKYEQYMQDSDVSETIQKARAQEMQDMQESLIQLQTSSEQEIQKRREELFKPIEDKVNRVIKRVAQENNYTHVLDASSILYIEDAYNLTPQVKQVLGIRN